MSRRDLEMTSHGVRVAAWHYRAGSDDLRGDAGRPCVVLAHGFGATRDTGLAGFAERFAAAGLDAVVFDYRGFGDSDGSPRQVVDVAGQLDDYRAAIDAARRLPDVDPDRVAVWGVSFAGGHVFVLAAGDPRLAAAVALTPATDGRAAVLEALRRDGIGTSLRATALALRDAVAAVRGREPVLAPLAGEPGTVAALTAPGAYREYTSMAGPSWRNEVAARAFLRLATVRPGRRAADVTCPLLVQIADLDRTAPPASATAAAARAPRAEVRHYPCDHFDVYPGQPWHEAAAAHQVAFLTRHLSRPAGAP
ncbi:MAG TPA: alpha/beta hydrolase [Pseudonocardia sp.]|jgi:pimeloyl-ACP methyl ester carboxylesterase